MSQENGLESSPFTGGMPVFMFRGFCFGLVDPNVLLIFMLLPDVKAAFQPGWGTPPPVSPEPGC